MRFLSATVVGLACVTAGRAGPVSWSYSTTGYTSGIYEIDPVTSLAKSGEAGAAVDAVLIGAYVVPNLTGPVAAVGPTGQIGLTITDAGSGSAGTIEVPFSYLDPKMVPATTDQFAYTPKIDDFGMQWVAIGGHQYTVTPSADRRGVTVTVDGTPVTDPVEPTDPVPPVDPIQTTTAPPTTAATPEPATLLLAAVGLAGVTARRLRRAK